LRQEHDTPAIPLGINHLDEAANICRIADQPALYSHLGSRGVIPLTILQSYAQAAGVWGQAGAKTLWSAATVKLIGAGMDDAAFAEDVSRLVGDHDVPADTYSTGTGAGRSTRTRSTRRERILAAADIRALPKGTALLLATGARPALIATLPWYSGPRAAAITAAISTAVTRIVTHQADHPGPKRD
ncbi:MAG: TraG/TraD/VirD4 family protein, partial [Frankiaceae bacterium]